MQKILLTLSLTVFVVLFSNAENPIAKSKITIKDNSQKLSTSTSTFTDCTVTASWTASGQDCFGNPITVTGSCTSTASSCSSAYSQAGGCAYTVATMGVFTLSDCP